MSPEQASGNQLDGRSDLYSLSLVVWFALTGELAISGENTQRVRVKQLTEAVPPIGVRRTDVPAALAAVIDRCAQKDRSARFATAEELVEALDASKLSAADVPSPVRLFAEETNQATLIVAGAVVFDTLLLQNATPNVHSFARTQPLSVAVAGKVSSCSSCSRRPSPFASTSSRISAGSCGRVGLTCRVLARPCSTRRW